MDRQQGTRGRGKEGQTDPSYIPGTRYEYIPMNQQSAGCYLGEVFVRFQGRREQQVKARPPSISNRARLYSYACSETSIEEVSKRAPGIAALLDSRSRPCLTGIRNMKFGEAPCVMFAADHALLLCTCLPINSSSAHTWDEKGLVSLSISCQCLKARRESSLHVLCTCCCCSFSFLQSSF